MADVDDVCTTLVGTIAALLYPSGTAQPSIAGVPVKVYEGWPVPAQLQTDIEAGMAHVSVYPRPEERNTTRYMRDWHQVAVNTPTLAAAVAGQQVTISGTAPGAANPQNVMVMANGAPYVYAAQPTDTPTAVAAALAALIAVGVPGTTSSGGTITLPTSARVTAARVGVSGTAIMEVRRQERVFQIGVWCASPQARKAIASPIDVALATATFLTMPDGTGARITYKNSPMSDASEKLQVYRRDLFYTVEFATVQTETEVQITQDQLGVQVAVAGVPPYQSLPTTYG